MSTDTRFVVVFILLMVVKHYSFLSECAAIDKQNVINTSNFGIYFGFWLVFQLFHIYEVSSDSSVPVSPLWHTTISKIGSTPT